MKSKKTGWIIGIVLLGIIIVTECAVIGIMASML